MGTEFEICPAKRRKDSSLLLKIRELIIQLIILQQKSSTESKMWALHH